VTIFDNDAPTTSVNRPVDIDTDTVAIKSFLKKIQEDAARLAALSDAAERLLEMIERRESRDVEYTSNRHRPGDPCPFDGDECYRNECATDCPLVGTHADDQ